jgi:FecR protein
MNAHSNDDPKEPMNDYLWDRSGAPDPEVRRLESLLSEFRHEERSRSLLIEMPRAARYSPFVMRLAAAAVVLLAFGAAIFFGLRPTAAPPDAGPGWQVSNLQGAPQIDSRTLSAGNAAIKLHVGQALTTDSSSRASLSEQDLGEIRVDPNSRVRLLQSGPNRKRIQLEVGTIHAAIWAPPTQFVVDTPSAVAVDLGCAYTLQVASDGSGTIRTALGWVGFHRNGRDSFIPAGAMCSTRPAVGPGTPYFEDASPKFRESLARFDSAAEHSADQNASLSSVLAEARAKDALTLWHLLSRTDGGNRQLVYHRLADLVPPPSGVDRNGVLQLDPHMLDLYWNALNLGDISIWRFWEQSASPNSSPSASHLQQKEQLVLAR